jgi:tetratricopeptide (TPR) repeat protein
MQIIGMLKKTGLMFLGIVIGLILVELCLTAAESIYSSWFQNSNQEVLEYDPDVCRIICLGDSWTLGMGVVPQQNYPKQLEMILNKSSDGRRFKVYNLGFPNFTSSMAIKKFKDIYSRLKPDIVIAMIGRSDLWCPENSEEKGSGLEVFRQKLLNTKIAKLIKISIYSLHYNCFKKKQAVLSSDEKTVQLAMNWIKLGNEKRDKRMFPAAEECYNKAIHLVPDLGIAFLEKARCYKIEGRYEKAAAVLSRALKLDISNNETAQELNDVFVRLNKPQNTVEFYYKLFQQNPDSDLLKNKLVNAYIFLADSLFIEKQFNKTIEIYEKALRIDPGNKRLYASIVYNQAIINNKGVSLSKYWEERKAKHLLNNEQDTLGTTLASNLRELVMICKKQNIQLILSGYPREMLKPIQTVAMENKIPLVDHRQSFKQAEDNLFVADGHCNSKGYKLVAENMAKQIYLLDKSFNN